MEVVVGSNNGPKRQAVISAFNQAYPEERISVETVAADSGVSAHPVSGPESLEGAINRVKHAKELRPGADYYVGIEGGLLQVGDRVWELGWVAIENGSGEIHLGLSSGVEMRGRLLDAIRSGQELNHILEKVFGIRGAGEANGFYGLTTDDRVTREQAYGHAILFALAPFKHPEYFE